MHAFLICVLNAPDQTVLSAYFKPVSIFLAEFFISSSWQRSPEAESSNWLQWKWQREHGVGPGHRYVGEGAQGWELCELSVCTR